MADISRIRVDSTTYDLKDARLPAPGADGTGLVSVNGEWVQTPGYGYSVTEDSFVLGEFTSANFTQEGTEYKATIPLTSELLALLQRMFINHEEFNVTIDGTTYNSVADQFTYTEDPSIYLQDVFRLEPNSGYTALTFFVPTVPSSARIYGSVTTYAQFDRRLLPPNENNLNIENGTGTRAVLVNDVDGNTASGNYATAEGYGTGATADYSHAEGYQSSASGQESHAEGHGTVASGTRSHSEGSETDALGNASHAEGANTEAFGTYSHAEGYGTLAGGQYSHSEGENYGYGGFTQIRITAEVDATNKIYSVESVSNLINVDNFILATGINGVQGYVQIVGIDSENLQIKLSERVLAGNYNVFKYGAFGRASHIEGSANIAILNDAHAEGNLTKAKGGYSHAEGHETNASGDCSHAEGYRTISGDNSHSEGHSTMANTYISHAEGYQTITVYRSQDGSGAHAEGYRTASFGSGAHAEGSSRGTFSGVKVLLTGEQNVTSESHTLNYNFPDNTAADLNSSVVGMYLVYTGEDFACNCLKISAIDTSHQTFQVINPHPALTNAVFMLVDNIAIGGSAHTEGTGTQAIGTNSHAEGIGTIANGIAQHVQGKFNIEDTSNTYAHVVGNGVVGERSNAHTLDWNGNAWYAGTVSAGTVANPAPVTNDNDLATKAYVDANAGGSSPIIAGENDGSAKMDSWTEGSYTPYFNLASGKGSMAIGINTIAVGKGSFTKGRNTFALGEYSSAEGYGNTTLITVTCAAGSTNASYTDTGTVFPYGVSFARLWDDNSHILYSVGSINRTQKTFTINPAPDVAISGTTMSVILYGATGNSSHSEGYQTWASSSYAHAEGYSTRASNEAAHAEGYNTNASGPYCHVEGRGCITEVTSSAAHAEGNSTYAVGEGSHAEGSATHAVAMYSHAEGVSTYANGSGAHSEGIYTNANGDYSHAEGQSTITGTTATNAHAEGEATNAYGRNSHAEGNWTYAYGDKAHAEGFYSEAHGAYSHAEGGNGYAIGSGSHAEGMVTHAVGDASHTEGSGDEESVSITSIISSNTYEISPDIPSTCFVGAIVCYYMSQGEMAYRRYARVTNLQPYGSNMQITIAPLPDSDPIDDSDVSSYGLSFNTHFASGASSHAEGLHTIATAEASHAEGYGTIAANPYQHVEGVYNVADTAGNYMHITGIGYQDTNTGEYVRKNGFTVDMSGNGAFAGSLTIADGTGSITLTAAQLRQLLAMLS